MSDNIITLTIGNMCMVDPWVTSLEETLVVCRSGYSPFGKKTKEVTEALYYKHTLSDARLVGYVPAGLSERVADHLKIRGYSVVVDDIRKWAVPPTPDLSKIDFTALRDGQDEMIEAVATKVNGVIEGPTGIGKSHIIWQICRMYPQSRIVVATPRKSVVRTLYNRMRADPEISSEVGVLASGVGKDRMSRIIVTTTKLMARTPYEDCDLLLLDECHCAGAQGVAESLSKFSNARVFGFSASPEGRGDKADILLEALVGPIRYKMPYQSGVASGSIVPIDVVMVTNKTGPYMSRGYPRLALKRYGVWTNKERNTLIATVASGFGDEQVLILCETIEHAMNIRKHLPGWTTVYAGCDKARFEQFVAQGYTDEPYRNQKEMDALQGEFETGRLRKAIATPIWREGCDFRNLAVLIRADAMAGVIPSVQIPGRLSRTAVGKTSGLLIDFMDSFNEDLRRSSEARLKAYKAKGWRIDVVQI